MTTRDTPLPQLPDAPDAPDAPDGTPGSPAPETPGAAGPVGPRSRVGVLAELFAETDAARVGRWLAERGIDPRNLLVGIGLAVAAFVLYTFVNHDRPAKLDYFVPLADAFLHGRLGLLEEPASGGYNELVAANGLLHVVYPPMPALVLVPFVAVFGPAIDQARIAILFGALNVALAWWVALAMGSRRSTALVLAIVFGAGTITWYSAQSGTAWHIAHVLSLTFALAAIGLALRGGPPLLVGLLVAAMGLCRLPMFLAAPFFLAWLLYRAGRPPTEAGGFGLAGEAAREAIRRVDVRRLLVLGAGFGLGLGVPLVLFGFYNLARFGSPLEMGYAMIPGLLDEWQYRNGFFSIANIPRKLYAMFLSAPEEVRGFPWIQSRPLGGLSIVLTTPVFLWAVLARRRDLFTIGAWTSVALVLVPILLHADPGGQQFGFRYAQDLYPFLYVLVLRALATGIRLEAWLAIAIGLLVNAWGMGSAYFDWWYRS